MKNLINQSELSRIVTGGDRNAIRLDKKIPAKHWFEIDHLIYNDLPEWWSLKKGQDSRIPITRDNITPRYLFCLDMAGVTDQFIVNFNALNKYPEIDIKYVNSRPTFSEFISCAFCKANTIEKAPFWNNVSNM